MSEISSPQTGLFEEEGARSLLDQLLTDSCIDSGAVIKTQAIIIL